MDEMQSSGSASGFDSYMEQLEGMTEQQKGINKGKDNTQNRKKIATQ